jgi:phosphatidylinositol dimannoside acyltransferase
VSTSGDVARRTTPDGRVSGEEAGNDLVVPRDLAKEARDAVVYLAYRVLGASLQVLPEAVAEAAAVAVGTLMARIGGTRRDMWVKHLRRIVGPHLSPAEVEDWVQRAFVSYARYWFDGARLPTIPDSVVLDRMTMNPGGMDRLAEGMAAGNGAILALPHIGSWEWGARFLALEGVPMTSVAEPVEPPALYEWFVSQREALGLTILPLDEDVGAPLLRVLRAGRLVGLLCDRDLVGNGIEVEFFGERTTLPAGPAMLALRTGAPLMPAAVYSGPGDGHSGVIMAPLPTERTGRLRDDVARVTQMLAESLEELIRAAPEQWHVFQPNWPSDRK